MKRVKICELIALKLSVSHICADNASQLKRTTSQDWLSACNRPLSSVTLYNTVKHAWPQLDPWTLALSHVQMPDSSNVLQVCSTYRYLIPQFNYKNMAVLSKSTFTGSVP